MALDRENLVKLLGSLRSVMREKKAPQNVQRRMAALKGETPTRAATFEIRAELEPGAEPGASASVVTVARGSCSGATFGDAAGSENELRVVLSEGTLLGGGASGTVRRVDLVDDRVGAGAPSLRSFALKRMRKTSVMSTPNTSSVSAT